MLVAALGGCTTPADSVEGPAATFTIERWWRDDAGCDPFVGGDCLHVETIVHNWGDAMRPHNMAWEIHHQDGGSHTTAGGFDIVAPRGPFIIDPGASRAVELVFRAAGNVDWQTVILSWHDNGALAELDRQPLA